MEMSAPNTDPLASSITAINVVFMKLLILFTPLILLMKYCSTKSVAELQNEAFLSEPESFRSSFRVTSSKTLRSLARTWNDMISTLLLASDSLGHPTFELINFCCHL